MTNKELIELYNCLVFLGSSGSSFWYAFAKNKRLLQPIVEGIEKDKSTIIDRFVVKDSVTQQPTIVNKRYSFKSDEDEREFISLVSAWEKETVNLPVLHTVEMTSSFLAETLRQILSLHYST